jgi:hypothetical protein
MVEEEARRQANSFRLLGNKKGAQVNHTLAARLSARTPLIHHRISAKAKMIFRILYYTLIILPDFRAFLIHTFTYPAAMK